MPRTKKKLSCVATQRKRPDYGPSTNRTLNFMLIETSAPTRVDLAGGTIDIPPLFLFHEGAATINFAVNLMARCRIETRPDNRIILKSIDQDTEVESTVGEIDKFRDE